MTLLRFTAVLAILSLCGCDAKVKVIDATGTHVVLESQLTDAQKVAALQNVAAQKGVYWYVFCVPKGEEEDQQFQAVAKTNATPHDAVYIEDGALPYWIATAATPAEAAYELSKELQHPADFMPDHKPAPVATYPDDCDYNTVLDSNHPQGIPCKKGATQ
jgi:hypothetical protein